MKSLISWGKHRKINVLQNRCLVSGSWNAHLLVRPRERIKMRGRPQRRTKFSAAELNGSVKVEREKNLGLHLGYRGPKLLGENTIGEERPTKRKPPHQSIGKKSQGLNTGRLYEYWFESMLPCVNMSYIRLPGVRRKRTRGSFCATLSKNVAGQDLDGQECSISHKKEKGKLLGRHYHRQSR